MKLIKLNFLIFIVIFLTGTSHLNGQEPISLDSAYVSSVAGFYKKATDVKREIWEGMELAPVCLFRYNGPALLYNHPDPPDNFKRISDKLYIGEQKDLQLFGATQIEINGTLTAIADYGRIHYSCEEEFYAELFHELHHVYQRTFIKKIEFDNPAVLLTYPENYVNDGIKLAEQKTLYRMCFADDSITFKKLLNQFYSSRLKREEIIGEYSKYEEKVENVEGPAFYSEYKFYNHFASIGEALKNNYNQKHFFGILTTPYYGRNSLRKRHLAAGMAMCLILDKHFDNWQADYYSEGLSLSDFFISRFNAEREALEVDSMYFRLSKHHTHEAILEHQLAFNKFNARQGVKVTLLFQQKPGFKGFDPMHAESINGSTILHKTLLRLSRGGDNEVFITNNQAVTTIDEVVWSVKKVILFAPKDYLLIKDNSIVADCEGIKVSWDGKLIRKTEKEIIFSCE